MTTGPAGKTPEEIGKQFVAGGLAGCCAKSTIAPLDRVKILLQAHHKYYKHLGVGSSLYKIFKYEGIPGLYRGNGAMMVRIFPYGAIQFVAYEWFHGITQQKMMSGSLAGMSAVICTYPLDVVRARLAFQVKGQLLYKGILHAGVSIWQQEGRLKAIYRGVLPTLLGMIPYAGTAFYTYETAKSHALSDVRLSALTKPSPNNQYERILNTPANLIIGGLAGAAAQTVAYPLDVVRRIMQLGEMPCNASLKNSPLQVLAYIYRTHGIQGLYRGLSINYMRAIPSVAVSFTVYEHMKRVFKIDGRKKTSAASL